MPLPNASVPRPLLANLSIPALQFRRIYRALTLLAVTVLLFTNTAQALPGFFVDSTDPGQGSILLTRTFQVTFNSVSVEDLDPSTLDATTAFVHSAQQGLVSGTWSASGQIATFRPTNDLRPGDVITVTLTSNIKTTDNEELRPYQFQFSVGVRAGAGTFRTEDIVSATLNAGANAADGASAVHGADLDGDRHLDILSASAEDDKIAWYKNDGSGSFTAQPAISTTADGASAVYAADLDGDGDMDVLSASAEDDKIAWYKNDGSGSFTAQPAISTTADGASAVYAADLDGDGDMDVLSASAEDDKIAWYKNDGSGSFTAQPAISTTADGASAVYVADLDGDGDMDVLSTSANDDTILWYANDGSESFSAQPAISATADGASDVYAADLDGDSDMDVLSASVNDDTILRYQSNGSGSFTAQPAISTTADGASAVYAADLDGDGDMDVLSASAEDDKIAWYKNDGTGTFTAEPAISTNADGASSIYTGDFNGDGVIDVLSASANDDKITVYFQSAPNPAGTFSATETGGSTAVAEGGATDQFSVVLSRNPGSNVVLDLAAPAGVTLSSNQLTFTSANGTTAQTVTVTAIDNNTVDGTRTQTITVSVNAAQSDDAFDTASNQTVSVQITDNDTAGIVVTETDGATTVTEGGATDQFTVVLPSNPSSDVVLDLVTRGGLSLSSTQLTFTSANGTTAQTVTVTAMDDNDLDGTRTGMITIRVDAAQSDDAFDALPDQTISAQVTDNDTAALILIETNSTTRVAEAGTEDAFQLRLSAAPRSNVVIDLTASSNDIMLSPTQITLRPFEATQRQTVSVSAVDDARIEGLETVTITASINAALSDPGFNNVTSQTLAVTVTDNDAAGFVLTPSTSPLVVSEVGTTATFTAMLTGQPASSVTLAFASADTDEATVAPATLTFAPDAWNQAQTVTVTGILDMEDDPDQTVSVTASVDAGSSDAVFASVPDQSLSVTVISVNGLQPTNDAATTAEDTPVTIDVRANDFDPAGQPLTIALQTPPTRGAVTVDDAGTPDDASDDVFVYTPNPDYHGPDSFTYTVSNGTDAAEGSVVLTVTPVNDAPHAQDDVAALDEDTVLTLHVRLNDADPERSALTLALVTAPMHGTLTLNDQGTPRTSDDRFEYTPLTNYNGTDRFTYSITDPEGLDDEATVSLTIRPVNDPPVANNDLIEALPGQPTFLDVRANDSDVDGTAGLTVRLTQGPFVTLGTVQLDDRGTPDDPSDDGLLYTRPKAEFQGMDRLTYELIDAEGAVSQQARVIVIVFPSVDVSGTVASHTQTVAASEGLPVLQRTDTDAVLHQQKTATHDVLSGIVVRSFGAKRLLYGSADNTPYLVHLPDSLPQANRLFVPGDLMEAALSNRGTHHELEQGYVTKHNEPIPAAQSVALEQLEDDPTVFEHRLIHIKNLSWNTPDVPVTAGHYIVHDLQGQALTVHIPEQAPLVGQMIAQEAITATGVFMPTDDGHALVLWEQHDLQVSKTGLSRVAGEVPAVFQLESNYPNPFNPQTTITFAVPEPSHVTVEVFNVLGERVAVVASQEFAAGRYQYAFDGTGLPSGMYLYRMVAGSFVQTQRMTLLK